MGIHSGQQASRSGWASTPTTRMVDQQQAPPRQHNLDEHLRRLLDEVEAASNDVSELMREQLLEADFFCFVRVTDQGGPVLSADTLARIGRLGATLVFEIQR